MVRVESAKMANMTWFNAVLIVALHVMNFAKPADVASGWLYGIVHDGVCSMAVPFFFLASGWFLGRHVDESGWWLRELKKRVRTILVPYGIFTAASLVLVVGYDAFTALAKGASVRAALPTVGGFVDALGLNPFVLPGHDVLWFLRTLMLALAALMWTLRAFVLGEYLKGWSAIFTNPIALCLIFGFVGLAPSVRMPGTWTSFAIFMLHSYVIMALKLETSLPSVFTCGYYIGVIGLAVGVPMGIAWVLNEYARPLAAVLFGGRIKEHSKGRKHIFYGIVVGCFTVL